MCCESSIICIKIGCKIDIIKSFWICRNGRGRDWGRGGGSRRVIGISEENVSF